MIPPLDPAGILMAVASAALFTVALVYVVRSKAGEAASPLTGILGSQAAPVAADLFADVFVEPRSPARGVALSVGLHILVLAAAPLLPYLFPDRLHFDFRRYNVKIMEFRIPAPLLYTPPERPHATEAPPQVAGMAARPHAAKPAGRLRLSQSATRSRRAQLQLPWEKHAKSKDVIIQPDQPPNVAISIPQPLPSSFLWAQQPTPAEPWRVVGEPPKPAPRKFTLPHSTPVVQQPNREASISDLQIASGPVLTFRDPQLPVFAANVAPVQMPVPGLATPGELPATALPGGSPLNLITLMNTPATPAAGYVVEQGNRLADSFPGSLALPGGSPSAFGAAGPGAGGVIGSNGSNQEQGTYADLLAANGNSSDAAGNGTASGSGEASGGANPPAHSWPTGGNLGVIIVQQSSEDSVLEGGEVLTGQPVYTVYFDVPGAPRRWILQYCVPGAESRAFTSDGEGVIHILPHRS
ncbi:MAG TPA: hypothetical protein VEU62_08195, partial [Bryobacterales bacterium]|nr:hypothetical protein [Bryobacterales bacterium]